MLTNRQSQILNAIVEEYVNSAIPVSSGLIFDKGIFDVSCPTIRNEMAELTDLGFLVQPHTSAGRVPTEMGYRFFVDEFISKKQEARDKRQETRDKRRGTMDRARTISQSTNDLVIFIDGAEGEVKYFGMKKIFEKPEFRSHEAVVSMLEELEKFENYPGEVCERLNDNLEIFIGAENPFFESSEYSMISSRFDRDLIALLGPMRMRYKLNLSLLG